MINNDINSLTNRAKNKVQILLNVARQEGLDCFIFEAKRSLDRQQELFWYGRTMLELKKYWVPEKYAKPNEKERTWTLQSKHLIWQAVDIVFDSNKDPKVKAPSWNWNYKRLIEIGILCWLYNLAPRETCHFEDDGSTIETTIKKNSDKWHKETDIKIKKTLHDINEMFRMLK